jgi:hypothetical protein
MLSGIVALLILQEVVGKAQVAASPAPSPEVVGKAQAGAEPSPEAVGKAAAAPPACVEMPEPGTDARSQSWYIDNEAMEVGGGTFVKYGLPRVLAQWEVEYHAASAGGLFYAEAGTADPEILYLLLDPAGCEFQPYQREG